MDDSQQWMEYRRMASEGRRLESEYRRREAEDRAEIEDLKRALDTAQRYNRLTCRPNGDLTPESARRLMDAYFGEEPGHEPEDQYDGLNGREWLALLVGGAALWALFALAMWVLEGGL